jgi:hypothetical protein
MPLIHSRIGAQVVGRRHKEIAYPAVQVSVRQYHRWLAEGVVEESKPGEPRFFTPKGEAVWEELHTRAEDGLWSLTPKGEAEAAELLRRDKEKTQ